MKGNVMSGTRLQQLAGWCPRLLRGGAIAVVGMGLLVLAAACGGSSGPSVASVSTSTPTVSLTPGPAAYSACIRSHGVPNFPDITDFGTGLKMAAQQSGADPNTLKAASIACQDLFVPPAGPTIPSADQHLYLEAAACMRSHGVPNFPDPVFENGGVKFNIPSSIDKNSPQVKSALTTCQKLIPAGLPYSGTD